MRDILIVVPSGWLRRSLFASLLILAIGGTGYVLYEFALPAFYNYQAAFYVQTLITALEGQHATICLTPK